jgi:hypothetical protein
MRRRVAYNFEIARRGDDERWHVLVARSGLFSRGPKATARSIVERWIFEQAGQLRGGRLVIVGRGGREPRRFDATVRVRVIDFANGTRDLAVAYIGTDQERGARRGPRRGADLLPGREVDRWELPPVAMRGPAARALAGAGARRD